MTPTITPTTSMISLTRRLLPKSTSLEPAVELWMAAVLLSGRNQGLHIIANVSFLADIAGVS